jgi:hypothetical protein
VEAANFPDDNVSRKRLEMNRMHSPDLLAIVSAKILNMVIVKIKI